jgi:hypothetical protein
MGGMPTKQGSQTAHEIQTLLTQSNERVKRVVERTEKNVITPLLRWYYQILFMTFNAQEAFRITNNETGVTSVLEITPQDIVGDYDFIPQGTTAMAKAGRVNKYLQLLSITGNPLDAQTLNRQVIIKKVAEGIGLADVPELMAPPPQQLAAAQGMGPQGSQPSPGPGGPPTLGPVVSPQTDTAIPAQGGENQ